MSWFVLHFYSILFYPVIKFYFLSFFFTFFLYSFTVIYIVFSFDGLRTPHSALRTPHSALRTPQSAIRNPQSASSKQPYIIIYLFKPSSWQRNVSQLTSDIAPLSNTQKLFRKISLWYESSFAYISLKIAFGSKFILLSTSTRQKIAKFWKVHFSLRYL